MAGGSGGEAGREGLFVALKNLFATLLAIGKTRAELLVSEIEEEKQRLMSLWAKAIAAAYLLLGGVVLGVICIAIVFWEQRLYVFGLASLLFLGVGLLLVMAVRRQTARPSKLFHASLAELEVDLKQLRKHQDQS